MAGMECPRTFLQGSDLHVMLVKRFRGMGVFCSKTANTIEGAHKWSRNGPETVLFWSRRVGAGDVHSRQDRAETLVESILRSAKALHQQKEGEHYAYPEHTPYRRIRCQSPQGGQQDRS